MYYAITVLNGFITDRHESALPFTVETFSNNPDYVGHELIGVSEDTEFSGGFYLDEYDKNGKLLPLIDRIMMGRQAIPEGYEIVEGELVLASMPTEEAPASFRDELNLLKQKTKELEAQNEMYADMIQELALMIWGGAAA